MNKAKIKVCILGASGFVGRALVERLIDRDDIDIRAVIRSPGNAWSILRFGLDLVQADVLNIESLRKAIKGCTHVVNLSLGAFNELPTGITNIIKVCNECGVNRLIHLSSITVYGDSPSKESEFETGPVLAKKGTYGWFKAQQDLIVEEANNKGLSSVVLCPPHITGAYGRIFHQVLDSITEGTFALIEDGHYPCNLVDINNLCNAIELSLFISETDGKRIFITNGDEYTWKDFALQVAEMAGIDPLTIPSIPANKCVKITAKKISLPQYIKWVLQSSNTKEYIKGTFIGRNKTIKGAIKKLVKIGGISTSPNSSQSEISFKNPLPINYNLCHQQLRGVRHKITRAEKVLVYYPKINSAQSFKTFEKYYQTLFDYNSEYWDLIKK